jgi:quinol monooxygenase YgiN
LVQRVRELVHAAVRQVRERKGERALVVDVGHAAARAEAWLRRRALAAEARRPTRLRQGALSWGLFRDTAVPGRYVESFVDESWVEHLRRHERFTAADEGLRAQRLALHRGDEPPVVKRYVGATLAADPERPL